MAFNDDGTVTVNPAAALETWSLVSSTYVMCSDDHTVAPALQREMMASAQHGVELDTDHSPFYSATATIVSLLAERAGLL
jgi:hypothetical protein